MAIKYYVTGAAGHLGSTIVKKLIEAGQSVRALVLPGDRAASHLPIGTEIYEGNILDRQSIDGFLDSNSSDERVVIQCAGIVSISSKFDQRVYDVNVTGTKNVVNEAKRTGVDRLIYVSSVHAIPEVPSGQVITETNDFSPDEVTGLYAQTKAEATQLVLDAARDGMNASVVHPSGIIGPNDYGIGHLTQLIIDYFTGSLTACVKGGYDFVDVRDVADGIISCSDKGRAGECYILSGGYHSVPEMMGLLHDLTGKRKVSTVLPLAFAKATAPLAELYYRIRHQKPLFTAYSLYTLNQNSLFSHRKAADELGYTSRPFTLTLADTINWLKQAQMMA